MYGPVELTGNRAVAAAWCDGSQNLFGPGPIWFGGGYYPVTLTIGDVPTPSITAVLNAASYSTGAIAQEVNAAIPAATGSGPQPVVVTIGGVASQSGVTVNVQ